MDDMQRYVLGDTEVIVCNQVRASMSCCEGGSCSDSFEHYGQTYVFPLEEKVGGIAALFNIMEDNGITCDFCMDKSENNALVSKNNGVEKEWCDIGYGWMRVENATELEDDICPVIEIEPIVPTVPTRTININSTILEITGGLDVGSPLSSNNATSSSSSPDLSAIKVGYRLSLQNEDFTPLYTGAPNYLQYSQECEPSRTGCCTIKYKDTCSTYPGIKVLSKSSMHITAVINETNVIMCGKTSSWDVCTDNFRYFGSTKYYELIQEKGSISVLNGIEGLDGLDGCDDVCLNEDGDVVVSFSKGCLIGAGWLRVKNYTIDSCDDSASDSISVNQTYIQSSLNTAASGVTYSTSNSHTSPRGIEPMSSTTDFPTWAPQPTAAPYETQEIQEIPAYSTGTQPVPAPAPTSTTGVNTLIAAICGSIAALVFFGAVVILKFRNRLTSSSS